MEDHVLNLRAEETTCQLCRKTLRIISLTMPASFKTECGRKDCPINSDCTAAGNEESDVPQFAYRVAFVYPGS